MQQRQGVRGLAAILGLVCGWGAPVALAQQPAQVMAFLDQDHDGKVSAEEYKTALVSRMASSDANGDGQFTPAEFKAALPPAEQTGADHTFTVFDADGSGALSKDEAGAYQAYIFKTFVDTDHDGFMSLAELEAVRGQAPAAAAAPKAQPAPTGLAALDANRDGKTDLNEYLNFQLPKLKQFDSNNNGVLSRQEFKASLPESARGTADRSFQAFDRDKSNGLDQSEFLGYHGYIFKNFLDANHDNFITQDEWAKLGAAR